MAPLYTFTTRENLGGFATSVLFAGGSREASAIVWDGPPRARRPLLARSRHDAAGDPSRPL